MSKVHKQFRSFVMVDGYKVPSAKVKIFDIESDIYGMDVVTFIYKGKQYKSYVTS
jgi:hypothetical protein